MRANTYQSSNPFARSIFPQFFSSILRSGTVLDPSEETSFWVQPLFFDMLAGESPASARGG